MPLWLRGAPAGLPFHRFGRVPSLPSIVELPESPEQDTHVDAALVGSGFAATLGAAQNSNFSTTSPNSQRPIVAAPQPRPVRATIFLQGPAPAPPLDFAQAQPLVSTSAAASSGRGVGPPLPRRHWRSFRWSLPVCVLAAVLYPRVSLPLISASFICSVLRSRSGTTLGTTLRSDIHGVVSAIGRIIGAAWQESVLAAVGVARVMGTVKSKPVIPEETKPDEIPLHSVLQQFISEEAKGVNAEMLDVTTVLLQSALATCMRMKERRSVMQCRVCWDEEIKVVLQPCKHACLCASCCSQVKACPICRMKISGRDEFILS